MAELVADGRVGDLGDLLEGLNAAADADSGKAITSRPLAVS